jgi:hypothetical protein
MFHRNEKSCLPAAMPLIFTRSKNEKETGAKLGSAKEGGGGSVVLWG